MKPQMIHHNEVEDGGHRERGSWGDMALSISVWVELSMLSDKSPVRLGMPSDAKSIARSWYSE